ncbi:MAG: phosphatase PAP2 family protein [Usitatibacter sp.]
MYPTAADLALAAWLHEHAIASPALAQAMLFVTDFHSNLAIHAMSAVVAVVLWRERRRDWLATLVLAVPAGLAINVALKHLFARTRPTWDNALLTLDTFGFPSGHVAGATLFYGFLAAYLLQGVEDRAVRAAHIAAAAMLVVLVAFSRVYLGVHYLTDVIGAAAWSLGWLTICLQLRKRLPARWAR